jgi:multidrug resistance efflux pump
MDNNNNNSGSPILKEVVKEEKFIVRLTKNKWFIRGVWIGIGVLVVFTAGYFYVSNSRVYIDVASVTAPTISLAPTHPGTLEELYVTEGQRVNAFQPVARVGDEIIHTKVSGIITSANQALGNFYNTGMPVVTMIDRKALTVDGRLAEDKGLNRIKVGQKVIFTVDAFGSRQFEGTVAEVSPTSRASDIVFSISDKREEQQFTIKAKINPDQYPELKPGMSARLWIYR